VLSLCGFTSVTTELLPSGLLSRVASDLGTGIAAAGSLTSVYAAAIVLTVLPLTRLTTRVPRRALFAAILCIFAAANLLLALSQDLPIAITGRILAGVAHGLLWATIAPVVGRITSPAQAPRAMAIVFAGTTLGLAAGAPLGTLLGEAWGWRTAFLILAGLSAALALLSFLTIPQVSPDTRQALSIARAVGLPGVSLIIGSRSVLLLAHVAVLAYIAPFLESAGLGEMVGAGLASLGIAGLVGVALAGSVPRRALYLGLLTAPALIVAGLLGLGSLPLNLTAAVVLLGIWGAGYAAAAVFDQQVVLIAGHEAPDTVTSVAVVAIQLGIALGAAVGGLTVETLGVAWIPLTGAIFAAASMALRIGMRSFLPRHTRPSAEPQAAAT
jgi:predicted MFS family arabinose efflux permease